MSEPSGLIPYRPGQGVIARTVTASALLALSLFGAARLFALLQTESQEAFNFLGMSVPPAALWAGGMFIVLGVLIFLLTFGVETGIQSFDSGAHRLIDLLIDTELELAKVAWPGSEELTRSTVAVLVCIVLLGAFLLAADWLIVLALRTAGVL